MTDIKFHISSSPHFSLGNSTQKIMACVLFVLFLFFFSFWIFCDFFFFFIFILDNSLRSFSVTLLKFFIILLSFLILFVL